MKIVREMLSGYLKDNYTINGYWIGNYMEKYKVDNYIIHKFNK